MPHEPEPFLKGEDVIKKLGIKPGKLVGEILDQLKEKQLGGEIRNKREATKWLTEFSNAGRSKSPEAKTPLAKLRRKS